MGFALIGSLLGIVLGAAITYRLSKIHWSEILFLLSVFGLVGLLVFGQIIKQVGTIVAQEKEIGTVEHIIYSSEITNFPDKESYYFITGEYYEVFLSKTNRSQRVAMNNTTFDRTSETPNLAQWERCYADSFFCWLLGPVETGYTIYLPDSIPFR